MIYLKMFEEFQDRFPDIFNGSLIRGVRIDKDEYIDDPKLRKVSIGNSNDNDYREFLKNYSKLGIPDPTKSIHMIFRPSTDNNWVQDRYGDDYYIIPQEGATFGFNKELRNGGLGSTWFFPERTAKDFLNKKVDDEFPDYYEDKEKFIEKVTKYQKMLIDGGIIGKLNYDELIKMSKEEEYYSLQVWTESPCLHKKIKKEPRIPKSYKKEVLLNDKDFIDAGIDNKGKSEFFKKYGTMINKLDTSIEFETRRKTALYLLKKWRAWY